MNLKLRTSSLIAELTIESGNTKITEDVAMLKDGVGYIPDSDIENFITIAREMNLFNDKSDVDFIKMIYDNFLNDYEREIFLESITNK